MVIREPQISESVKYWIKPNIKNRIKEGAIKAYFNSEIKEIKISNDFVFAMIDYHPNYDFSNKIEIKCDTNENNKPYYKPSSHETNIKGLFVAGIVCGGKHTSRFFIENSMEHGGVFFWSIS